MAKRKKNSAQAATTSAVVDDRAATDPAVAAASDVDGGGGHRPPIDITDPYTGKPVELGDLSDADGGEIPATEAAEADSCVVLVKVPFGPPPGVEESCPRHVDVQLRSAYNRTAMRRLLTGLDLSGARLADGNRVTTYVQAVTWLLEQLGVRII